MAPAKSICDMSQPPKISPLELVSAGMASVCKASVPVGIGSSSISDMEKSFPLLRIVVLPLPAYARRGRGREQWQLDHNKRKGATLNGRACDGCLPRRRAARRAVTQPRFTAGTVDRWLPEAISPQLQRDPVLSQSCHTPFIHLSRIGHRVRATYSNPQEFPREKASAIP